MPSATAFRSRSGLVHRIGYCWHVQAISSGDLQLARKLPNVLESLRAAEMLVDYGGDARTSSLWKRVFEDLERGEGPVGAKLRR